MAGWGSEWWSQMADTRVRALLVAPWLLDEWLLLDDGLLPWLFAVQRQAQAHGPLLINCGGSSVGCDMTRAVAYVARARPVGPTLSAAFNIAIRDGLNLLDEEQHGCCRKRAGSWSCVVAISWLYPDLRLLLLRHMSTLLSGTFCDGIIAANAPCCSSLAASKDPGWSVNFLSSMSKHDVCATVDLGRLAEKSHGWKQS